MIVEHYKRGQVHALYERFEKKGRQLPKGVFYIDSWIDDKVEKCFQLMETEQFELFQDWMRNWEDLTRFEIVEIGMVVWF